MAAVVTMNSGQCPSKKSPFLFHWTNTGSNYKTKTETWYVMQIQMLGKDANVG